MVESRTRKKKLTTRYGLFVVRCMNVGDDIQSIADLRFLPKVDYFINRDNIRELEKIKLNKNEKLKMIMNGWYTAGYNFWPPKKESFIPLLTSIHINPLFDQGAVIKQFEKKEVVDYFKNHGPVGARDLYTLEFFKRNGIDAYFSACMTLTLKPENDVKKEDFILAVNVSDEVYESILARTNRVVIRMDVERTQNTTVEENFALAKYYLYMYQSAHCVVTTRLHATLPTIAIGGRVLFIIENNNDNIDFKDRFSGLHELAHHLTDNEFVKDTSMTLYNLENPPQNPDTYKKYRDKLVEIATEYTGFDNSLGYLQGKTIDEVLLSADFFSALTKLSEESWEAYKFKHRLAIPEILREEIVGINQLKAEIESLRRQVALESNPGVKMALRRMAKSMLYKTGLKHRPKV